MCSLLIGKNMKYSFFSYNMDEKYLSFALLTDSCDNKANCDNWKYINAVSEQLEKV